MLLGCGPYSSQVHSLRDAPPPPPFLEDDEEECEKERWESEVAGLAEEEEEEQENENWQPWEDEALEPICALTRA